MGHLLEGGTTEQSWKSLLLPEELPPRVLATNKIVPQSVEVSARTSPVGVPRNRRL
jgi:hypothetical protein